MRIDCPILGDRYLHSMLNSSCFTAAEKKQMIQWRREQAYRQKLIHPKNGFFAPIWTGPAVDPMKLNRRRQLRVPLLQQRPRDGCR